MNDKLEQLLPVVKRLTERYTGKDSTSVTYELAEQLMGAVIYCIKEQERVKSNGTGARGERGLVEQDGGLDAEAAYERGYELVLQKTMRVKTLYETIIHDFQSYGNRCYYDTVVKGMPEFFLHYDARFCPQNHILTLDYPVIIPLKGWSGVDAIYRYLSCIWLEQLFLSAFPEAYIRDVLFNYHHDCKNLFVNVCGIVEREVLRCMMAEKSIGDPVWTEEEIARIQTLVDGQQRDVLKELLKEQLTVLVHRGYRGDKRLLAYLSGEVEDFSFELMKMK